MKTDDLNESDRIRQALRLLDEAHAALIAVDWRSVNAMYRIDALLKIGRLVDYITPFSKADDP